MHKGGHRLITREALRDQFSPCALDAIISANVYQDRPAGQVGHDEFHFDNNAFAKGMAYLEKNRIEVRTALEKGDALHAWNAFGRLTHAAQDFYAHSNYVTLWLDRFPADAWPSPEEIEPLDRDLLTGVALPVQLSPSASYPKGKGPLRSGRIYLLEPLSWIPSLKKFILPLLPHDSHAWMNLDTAAQGSKYAYAYAAAVKRTRFEFDITVQSIEPDLLARFMGKIHREV
jgi:hypothetical protein